MRQNKLMRANRPGLIEKLETRTLLSVNLDGDLLRILGTAVSDQISVVLVNGNRIDVNDNGVVSSFSPNDVRKIFFQGGSGGDKFEMQRDLAIPVEAYGGIGRDTVISGSADDVVYGNKGADLLVGNGGSDVLRAGLGNDRVLGGGKVDSIFGGEGDDSINSGAGDDVVVDNSGTNAIDAGAADTFQPLFSVRYEPMAFLPNVIGYDPSQIRRAYGLGANENNSTYWTRGAGQTIYIVDAFSGFNTLGDLISFSQQFDLPMPTAESFQIVNEGGRTPAIDSGWAAEIALDVQWAHAIAPGAKIVLVQADSNMEADLFRATRLASQMAQDGGGGVVSMSFGRTTNPGFRSLNEGMWNDMFRSFTKATYIASSGDGTLAFPGVSPYVTSVGGTKLSLDSEGNRSAEEIAWEFGGAGLDFSVQRPAFQRDIDFRQSINGPILAIDGRGAPDVSYNADPDTPFAVFSTTPFGGNAGWFALGGTSAGAPQWAAITAIANQRRAAAGQSVLGNGLNGALYDLHNAGTGDDNTSGPFMDIVDGTALFFFDAFPGYDLATGIGVPNGDILINALSGSESFYIQKQFEFTSRLQLPLDTPAGVEPPRVNTGAGQPRSGHGFMTGSDLLQLEFRTDEPNQFFDPNGFSTFDEYFDLEEGQTSFDTVTLYRTGRGQTSGAIYGIGNATIFNTNPEAYAGAGIMSFTLKFEGTWQANADGSIGFSVRYHAVDPITYGEIPSGPFQLRFNPLLPSQGAFFSGELEG